MGQINKDIEDISVIFTRKNCQSRSTDWSDGGSVP